MGKNARTFLTSAFFWTLSFNHAPGAARSRKEHARIRKQYGQAPVLATSSQIRAARALLQWTASELSLQSALSLRTIQRAELAETFITPANDLAISPRFGSCRRRIHQCKWRRPGRAVETRIE